MTKVTGLQRKKSEKERMTWGAECLRYDEIIKAI